MKSKSRWIVSICAVVLLGLVVDYYFLHVLFREKQLESFTREFELMGFSEPEAEGAPLSDNSEGDDPLESLAQETSAAEQARLLEVLRECAPEVVAQGITTQEGLITYIEKSVGILEKQVDIENYNIVLPDNTERRLHLIPLENSNSTSGRELRYFKLDDEGYPIRIPLRPEESMNPSEQTIKTLVSQGQIKLHQLKSHWNLKDGTQLQLEVHNDEVFEVQWVGREKTLSCRLQDCVCR